MRIKVLFVCHGNICRSPMAEFVFKDLVEKNGLGDSFDIASAATSTEEIGNPVHPGTRKILASHGISSDGKCAVQLTKSDYLESDFVIAMDQRNVMNINRIIGNDSQNKVQRLLDYTEEFRDIDDPWYTNNFNKTYEDVSQGCISLLKSICEKHKIR